MSFVTLTEAVHLVKELKFFYGKQFTERWIGISDTDLAVRFAALLADVHVVQFEYGLKKMETSEFVPTMPQFKNWCLEKKAPGQNWLSTSEAWALCLAYDNNEDVQVSKQAMSAFKKIRHVLYVEGQKAAHSAFKGFYERIVERDKELNRIQEAYIEPPKLTDPDDFKAARPRTAEENRLLRENLAKINKLNLK